MASWSLSMGGHTPFSADISAQLSKTPECVIVVRAEDDPHDLSQPRGQQDWKEVPPAIWYHRTSGIWQPVWLEWVPDTSIGRSGVTNDDYIPTFQCRVMESTVATEGFR